MLSLQSPFQLIYMVMIIVSHFAIDLDCCCISACIYLQLNTETIVSCFCAGDVPSAEFCNDCLLCTHDLERLDGGDVK